MAWFRVVGGVVLAAAWAATAGAEPAGIEPAGAEPAGTLVTDPLAPARSGLLECSAPDSTAHTCHSLATYTALPGGAWSYVAETLISRDRPVTLTVTAPAYVRDAMVCGTMRREDLMAGTLRFGGQPLPADKAQPLLARLAAGLAAAGVLDAEACEATYRTAAGLVLRGAINGKPMPLPDRPVMWVRPGDGWFVAPVAGAGPAPGAPTG